MTEMSIRPCVFEPVLDYSYDDDGVHLVCDPCGYDERLGFNAELADVLKKHREHFMRNAE